MVTSSPATEAPAFVPLTTSMLNIAGSADKVVSLAEHIGTKSATDIAITKKYRKKSSFLSISFIVLI